MVSGDGHEDCVSEFRRGSSKAHCFRVNGEKRNLEPPYVQQTLFRLLTNEKQPAKGHSEHRARCAQENMTPAWNSVSEVEEAIQSVSMVPGETMFFTEAEFYTRLLSYR